MKALLYKLARLRVLSWTIPHVISQMSTLFPDDILFETNTLLAFPHPQPSYPIHILIVPKKKIAGLIEIREEDLEFMVDLFRCVRYLVRDFSLDKPGYRLVSNGGKYQEIPQLHFHVISGEA